MCLGVALPIVAELGLRSVSCSHHQVFVSKRNLLPAPLRVFHLRHVYLGIIETAMRRVNKQQIEASAFSRMLGQYASCSFPGISSR